MRLVHLALFMPAICLAQAPSQPRLNLPEPSYDFGKIPPGQKVTHRFKATNAGTAPLTITQVNPGCGCTSSVVGKDTLAPGESTELEVSFDPAGMRGLAQKSVQVLSNDPVEPSQVITFQADVLPAVVASTDQVQFTGLVRRDRRKASVKLESETGQPIRVTNVELSPAPWLGVTTREVGNDAWVDFDLLARRLPAAKLSGVDTVTLHVANLGPSTVQLSVRWERLPPVTATPGKIAWAEPAGRELRAAVVLQARQGRPFRILSARTSNPLIRVAGFQHPAASRQEVQLILSDQAKPGTYDEKAFFTLDTPGHPEMEVRIVASLR
jgi:hypothetical protein